MERIYSFGSKFLPLRVINSILKGFILEVTKAVPSHQPVPPTSQPTPKKPIQELRD